MSSTEFPPPSPPLFHPCDWALPESSETLQSSGNLYFLSAAPQREAASLGLTSVLTMGRSKSHLVLLAFACGESHLPSFLDKKETDYAAFLSLHLREELIDWKLETVLQLALKVILMKSHHKELTITAFNCSWCKLNVFSCILHSVVTWTLCDWVSSK